MWNPNWTGMPPRLMGGLTPARLLPDSYAWWLRRREEVRKLYPTGNDPDD